MKKIILTFLFTLIYAIQFQAQTQGDLTVTTSTSEVGGNYAPNNIVAIWVEDDAGNFVKTLLAYAATRITHLNMWQASTIAAGSEFNRVDAITGATRTSHATRNCSWNAKDFNDVLVLDGTYSVWMELTDQNGTGNFSSFPFAKGTNADTQTPADVPSFSSISINWEPDTSGVLEIDDSQHFSVYPNPSTGIYTIKMDEIGAVTIRNILGKLIFTGKTKTIDLSNQPNGIYLLTLTIDSKTATTKLIKK